MKLNIAESAERFFNSPEYKKFELKQEQLKVDRPDLAEFQAMQELPLLCCTKYQRENPECVIGRCDYCCEMESQVCEYLGIPLLL